jgi:hypothetical protein
MDAIKKGETAIEVFFILKRETNTFVGHLNLTTDRKLQR